MGVELACRVLGEQLLAMVGKAVHVQRLGAAMGYLEISKLLTSIRWTTNPSTTVSAEREGRAP